MAQPSKTLRMLDALEAAGDRGMRFSDIQRLLWEMTHPVGSFGPKVRGYWCTNLCGGPFYHRGILNFFATKGKDGRWRRNERAHGGQPWAVMRHPEAHGFTDVEPNGPWGWA